MTKSHEDMKGYAVLWVTLYGPLIGDSNMHSVMTLQSAMNFGGSSDCGNSTIAEWSPSWGDREAFVSNKTYVRQNSGYQTGMV